MIDNRLVIRYHEFDKSLYYRVDTVKIIELNSIRGVFFSLGKRGALHKIRIYYLNEFFELSKNHKELCAQIYRLLEPLKIKIIITKRR